MPHPDRATSVHPEDVTPAAGASVLLRIFWVLFGNIIAAVCAVAIAMSDRSGFFTWADPVYWLTVAALIAARYTDIVRYGGTTADGQPATLAHWRRYATVVAVASILIWAGAHAVAYATA
jgi:hypothetical protein